MLKIVDYGTSKQGTHSFNENRPISPNLFVQVDVVVVVK